jgi:D-glycero-D-manno-heptose 1,7-bisphosphate phosphatase
MTRDDAFMPVDQLAVRLHPSLSEPLTFGGKAALFLDRDGVVVEEKHYLSKPDDVVLSEGIVELLRLVKSREIPVCVITNQSGIDRGLFDWQDFFSVSDRIDHLLDQAGVMIDVTIACPFHPDFTRAYSEDHSALRKPGPGMFTLSSQRFGLDLHRSLMVGDNASDIQAAKAAGLPIAVHVLIGHGQEFREAALALADAHFHVAPLHDLTDAYPLIERHFV